MNLWLLRKKGNSMHTRSRIAFPTFVFDGLLRVESLNPTFGHGANMSESSLDNHDCAI